MVGLLGAGGDVATMTDTAIKEDGIDRSDRCRERARKMH